MTPWLDRRIAAPGPYLTLCLTEEEFKDAMKHLNVEQYGSWIKEDADATAHVMEHPKGGLCCVVCLSDWEEHTPIEVAGMLVHESVHIWQQYADSIGEESPGREQEAYAVQGISQELMAEFARRMEQPKKGKRK